MLDATALKDKAAAWLREAPRQRTLARFVTIGRVAARGGVMPLLGAMRCRVRQQLQALWTRARRAIGLVRDWLRKRPWLGALSGRLAGRIVALNLVGLVILTALIIFLSPYQASLIRAKLDNMVSEGQVIAATIAASATRESDRLVLEPELLDPAEIGQARQPAAPRLEFPIRPELVAPILKRVVQPTGIRIRLFRPDGAFMFDSDILLGAGNSEDHRVTPSPPGSPVVIRSFWTWLSDWMDGTDLPVYRDIGRANALAYPEVADALKGTPQSLMLMNERGRRTVTIAVPIRRHQMLGVMLLSSRDGEIDKLVWEERRTILWLAVTGAVAMAITSLLLAATIAWPLRQLANAADRVKRNPKRRAELPDHSGRKDEIAHLSGSLREMTEALYRRIETSERFAADVSHELKNPLTSVRSAAETLTLVKTDEQRKTLTDTIQSDVKRLTRLIDDIAKATRADAEMALSDAGPVDMADLLRMLTEMFNGMHVRDGQGVVLELASTATPTAQAYQVTGHDSRLGQVFKNLIDNALSFSPAQGKVWIRASREEDTVAIAVEDEGPGIPPDNLERIFNRFYTDRPVGSFGNNSGLGLSISQEIVLAHHGSIWAENRTESTVQRTGTSELGVVTTHVTGARFVVHLPAAQPLNPPRGLRAWPGGRR